MWPLILIRIVLAELGNQSPRIESDEVWNRKFISPRPIEQNLLTTLA